MSGLRLWPSMTGMDLMPARFASISDRRLDSRLRGNDRETVQRDAAGSLRVSLKSLPFLSPKNGGQGVDTA